MKFCLIQFLKSSLFAVENVLLKYNYFISLKKNANK